MKEQIQKKNVLLYCENCGVRIDDIDLNNNILENNSLFCQYCGIEIDINIDSYTSFKSSKHENDKDRNNYDTPLERILYDTKLPNNFKQNLIIVIARLSYEPIREFEQILNKKIRNIKLTKELLDKLESVIKPITYKEIRQNYLKNLYKNMKIEDFNHFHTLLKENLKLNPNYEHDFIIFLRWIIFQVFTIIKKKWNNKGISSFHKIVREDLKKFFNVDHENINKNNLKINSRMIKIMVILEENFERFYSVSDLADEIKADRANIAKDLNYLLKHNLVDYRYEGKRKLWKAIKKIPKNEKIQHISVDKLKELYVELWSFKKIARFLENQGFSKIYHPTTIDKKIRESFHSIEEYEKWKNEFKVNKLIEIAKLKGGKFLGNKYLGMKTTHIFYCEKHKRNFNITPDCLINRGQWCPKCGHEKAGKKQRLKIENLEKIIKKRGGKLISKTYGKDQCDPIIIECKMRHKFSILPKTLKRGAWCDICSSGINENITRKMFEYIFNVKFPKSTPKWLITKKGFQMHLDGYSKQLNIAFEFQGKQHYLYHSYFHKNEDAFHKQQKTDLLKRKLCKENKVKLIEVPYFIKKKDRFIYIIDECKKRNIKIRKDLEPKNWNDFKIYLPEKYERYKKMANSFGFDLVSGTYRGFYQKVTLICQTCNINLYVTPNLIQRKVREEKILECPNCKFTKNIKKIIDKIQDKNGRPIKFKFKGKDKRLYFLIECMICNYQWWLRDDAIMGDVSWCPKCSGKEKRTIERINKFANRFDGRCINREYFNKHTYFTFQCNKCNHQWKSTYDMMKKRKYFCPACK